MENILYNSVSKKRYIYPIWWVISWIRYCKTGRKIASLLLFYFFIQAFVAPFSYFSHSEDLGENGAIVMTIFTIILFAWPFLLVIAPPEVNRNDIPCCSGCGHTNHDLRVVEYKIGIALFGLIPIIGVYKRTLCKVCRNSLYRIAIILENLFSLIWFPVGTVLGIIWLFKNQSYKRINIIETFEILEKIKDKLNTQNENIEAQKIQTEINELKLVYSKQISEHENLMKNITASINNIDNEEELNVEIGKKVDSFFQLIKEGRENKLKNKDIIRGRIVTLSYMNENEFSKFQKVYNAKYNLDLINDIMSLSEKKSIIDYFLEPLIEKGLIKS